MRQVHVCSTSIAFPISVLQAKLFFFAVTKNRIGHGPRCRHSRSRRAIHRCSNDGAASIRKSGPEIKNRCTQEGVNGENPASIPKSGLEIKNRCTQGAVNRENLTSIRKSGPKIKNRCTLEEESGQETLEGIITDNGFIRWNGSAANSRMQYFLRDHLGSVRVIAEDRHTVISRTDYLPFGVRMSGDGLTTGNATGRSSWYGFSGKENEMWGGYDTADGDTTPHWLKGDRYQHFGARAYDPVSCIFMQVDPMAEKYYGMTPYGYCAGNPVMFMDPQGDTLIADQSAQLNIKHTLSAREARYVRFDESGQLDNTRLLKSNSNSTNMTALKLLSSCTTLYLAIVSDNAFGDVFYEKGSKIDYPENFNYGVTCMPNASQNPSPDNNVYIFTAFFLNSEGKVTNTAHELYGHAYFYELSKTSDVNPNHVYGVVGKGISYEEGYGFLEHNIYGETNLKLLDQINKATNEAIKNFKKYWDNF